MLVVGDFRIYVVDKRGVVLLTKDKSEGIHHLHQSTISIIAGCAGSLQCSYGYAHFLVGALQGEGSYSLVGFLQVGYECRQAQRVDLCRKLAFEVCDEVDQKTRLLVELPGGVDLVVLDVL